MTLYEVRLRRAVRCLRLQWYTTESAAVAARRLSVASDAVEGLLDLAAQRGDDAGERVLCREWERIMRIERRVWRFARGVEREGRRAA